MSWRERLNLKEFVFLRKSQACESCGETFSCEITVKGCWCGNVKVSRETREYLRQNYKLCLCRQCLEKFENQLSQKSNADEK